MTVFRIAMACAFHNNLLVVASLLVANTTYEAPGHAPRVPGGRGHGAPERCWNT